MSQQINFLRPGCNYNPDLLSHLFFSLKPEEVGQATTVCTDWEKVATTVAKQLLLIKAENHLKEKLFLFFKETRGNITSCFPSFSQLSAQQNSLSTTKLNDELKKLTSTKKLEISCVDVKYVKSGHNFTEMQNLTEINPFAMATPKEEESLKQTGLTLCNLYNDRIKREDVICERAFIAFFYRERWLSFTTLTSSSFFPIELFSLKAQGENYKLEGRLNSNYCVVVNGEIIEFVIQADPYLPNNVSPVPSYCSLDPLRFYIPALDARAPIPVNALE